MTTLHYALSWADHLESISKGLSSLQQKEELVDMTLAADGHFIKVHKVIMAIASQFFKEIICSTKCDHPVVYLNKVSYQSLIYILEYIYTGEVHVEKENMEEFVSTAQDLQIKGLKDIYDHYKKVDTKHLMEEFPITVEDTDDIYYPEVQSSERENTSFDLNEESISSKKPNPGVQVVEKLSKVAFDDVSDFDTTVHYTMSNRGSIQMILNKFMYYLKHKNKDNSRQWRCVDYLNSRKCPALIFTEEDLIVKRVSIHNHKPHDNKIKKRIMSGNIFKGIQEAEEIRETNHVMRGSM
ncbi:unnamed protein product [Leptosia nina]|uniref:BTB domain-containing protein n=1 Tax=Leptosia nina TaxID=320188 RepID=A0AAV1JJZ1_9NEOP